MRTFLDEILQESVEHKSSSVPAYHSTGCSCTQCCRATAVMVPGSSHLGFRARKNLRWQPQSRVQRNDRTLTQQEHELQVEWLREAENELPAIPKANLVSFGKNQRAELLRYWQQKAKKTKNPALQTRFQQYADTIANRSRPSWHQSERDLQYYYRQVGGTGQRAFAHNRPARWTTNAAGRRVPERGSVIPDIVTNNAMIEVKNYSIDNVPSLLAKLREQTSRRREHGPADKPHQSVILDMRGQKATPNQLNRLAYDVANATQIPHENIQVVTWEL